MNLADAEPVDFDLTPWEPLVIHSLVRKFRFALGVPLAVIVYFAFPAPNNSRFAIPCVLVGVYGLVAYIRGTANVREHPFLQMLAWQRDQARAIYLFYTRANGFRFGPFLTVTLDDDQVTIAVPEPAADAWLARLRAVLPNAEYKANEPPPPTLSARGIA